MGSRSSSDARSRRPGPWLDVLLLTVSLLMVASAAGGCVTVQPQDKEFLANPAMIFSSESRSHTQEQHVFTNREGSFGGGGVSGGGCGCN